MVKVNLCGTGLEGFINVDISWKADIRRNLNWRSLPFDDNSVDVLLCMSAINYFTKERGQYLINEVHRILKPVGVCRFGVQDMKVICEKYLTGEFECDRVNRWFGLGDGYISNGQKSKYVYDYPTLSKMFDKFIDVRQSYYKDEHSYLAQFDNRPEQMFYLEAVK